MELLCPVRILPKVQNDLVKNHCVKCLNSNPLYTFGKILGVRIYQTIQNFSTTAARLIYVIWGQLIETQDID